MVKWESPIFSDLRNQLGETVVFSSWKGQNYMREYVDVLGGDEPEQRAIRQKLGGATKTWQFLVEHTSLDEEWEHFNSDLEGIWEDRVEDENISGFNLFTRYFMGAEIAVEYDPEEGLAHIEWKHDIDDQPLRILYVYRAPSESGDDGVVYYYQIRSDPDKIGSWSWAIHYEGWHRFFIAFDTGEYLLYNKVLIEPFAHYSMDLEAGTAEPAMFWL